MNEISRARVTPGLPMYAKFWLFSTAIFTISAIVFWKLGADGVAALAQDRLTLYAASLMVFMFLVGLRSTHGVVRRLLRDQQALDSLEKHLGDHVMKPYEFRHKVLLVTSDPVKITGRASRVAHALKLLGRRHNRSKEHEVKTPMNRSAFHDDFESGVSHDIDRVDFYVMLYTFLGLVGFTGIIYLTWKGLPVPKTVEQVGEYNRYLLTGLGLTYLLTFLGIASATIIYVAKYYILYDHSHEVAARFRDIIFSDVFPVLHGSMAGFKEDHHET